MGLPQWRKYLHSKRLAWRQFSLPRYHGDSKCQPNRGEPGDQSRECRGGGSDGASIQDVTSILPLPSQTITFRTLTNQPFGTAPFQISSSASSGLTVGINSQTPSVCTISGSIVTLVWVGTCTIQATQSGNTNWASAAPVTRSFQVTGTPCDLKPNSNIDVADVQLIVNQSLGASPAVNDVSGDGAVNVIDVQIELNAALGLGCAWK